MTAEELDTPSLTDPTHNRRDYSPEEVLTTTWLRKCGDAFKAWQKSPTPANTEKLGATRAKFHELCRDKECPGK